MGCDGGTIPRRDELVRLKKKPEQKDKDAERSFKWRNCTLSQQQLQEPIVSCGIGRLYSKSSVLEALLDKDNKPESISHIKNLKDIKDLQLNKNPAYNFTEQSDGSVNDSAPYICPIIGLEMTGKFRFIFLWSCGCVFAERALKEIKQNICHKCQKPFKDEDIVVINGTEEDIKQMEERMAIRNANRKTNKKSKADKAQTKAPETVTAEIKTEPVAIEDTTAKNEIVFENGKIEPKTEFAEPGTSNVVKKEMETIPLGLPKYNDKRPPARGHFGSSKRAHGKELVDDPSYKKTKKDYSVAEDPKSSDVYKSLFTSHKSEQQQNRAHWVTYNPFYN